MPAISTQINIQRLINGIESADPLLSIIEAVVNSIQSIHDSGTSDGIITITLNRSTQKSLGMSKDPIPSIEDIIIKDNGGGFNDQNLDSFNTVYSDLKITNGGKGFGRFLFLKFFDEVKVESIFKKDSGTHKREFNFIPSGDSIISNLSEKIVTDEVATEITLRGIKDKYKGRTNKKLDTIARKLVEKLLVYFISENTCPKIYLRDSHGEEILLNEFIGADKAIQKLTEGDIDLKDISGDKKEKFKALIFKVYYSDDNNSLILAAHQREVQKNNLSEYIPELKESLVEEYVNEKKEPSTRNYSIKVYVMGPYLDSHVDQERSGFKFSRNKREDMFYPFSAEEIEEETAKFINKTHLFDNEIGKRFEIKKRNIEKYVNEKAPWHKAYLKELNIPSLPTGMSEVEIELELQRIKFENEQSIQREMKNILTDDHVDAAAKITDLISKINTTSKNDLIHYVSSRKIILTILKDALARNDDGSSNYEEDVHNIIFPMGKDSISTKYEDHNLWLLDERLVFTQYIASDKKIEKKAKGKEPDLVIFDSPRAFRAGDNEFSNPVTIFEFKRPKRTSYSNNDDPIIQITEYVDDIRKGKYETPDGVEKIKVDHGTPIYGYIICDMCPKIEEFAKRASLKMTADKDGYIGYHSGYDIFIQIMNYSKFLKDAKLRNKIFFDKLGLPD